MTLGTPRGSLENLIDTNITSVGDNEILTYDNATSKWINETREESQLFDRLVSTATDTTLILTDDGAGVQTLTASGSTLKIEPTNLILWLPQNVYGPDTFTWTFVSQADDPGIGPAIGGYLFEKDGSASAYHSEWRATTSSADAIMRLEQDGDLLIGTSELDLTKVVREDRNINTSAGISGGGALSSDLTLTADLDYLETNLDIEKLTSTATSEELLFTDDGANVGTLEYQGSSRLNLYVQSSQLIAVGTAAANASYNTNTAAGIFQTYFFSDTINYTGILQFFANVENATGTHKTIEITANQGGDKGDIIGLDLGVTHSGSYSVMNAARQIYGIKLKSSIDVTGDFGKANGDYLTAFINEIAVTENGQTVVAIAGGVTGVTGTPTGITSYVGHAFDAQPANTTAGCAIYAEDDITVKAGVKLILDSSATIETASQKVSAYTAGTTYFVVDGTLDCFFQGTEVWNANASRLETLGGRIHNTTRVTTTYTALATDEIIFCDTDGGAFTLDLPVGVEGTHYKIINCGSSGNDLTVDADTTGSSTVYGATTAVLSDGEVINIHYNATEGWW